MGRSCLLVAAGVAGWLVALPAQAASFVLEDGETIEGAIVEMTRNTVVIRRAAGGMRQIPLGRLQRVRVTTADGITLGGPFGGWRDGRTGIQIGAEVVWIEHDRVVARDPSAGPAGAPADPPARAAVASPAPRSPPESPPAPAPPAVAAAEAPPDPAPARTEAPEPAAGPEPAALPAADLPVISVRVAPAAVTEATGEIVFTVELSQPIEDLLVVIYSTVDGGAAAGADYQPLQGILTLSAGATRSEIRTAVIDDSEPESDEEFNLFLAANPELTRIAQQWTQVTIEDDD